MGALIRIILTLGAFFAAIFLLVRLTGLFSIEEVSIWLEKARNINLVFLFMAVMLYYGWDGLHLEIIKIQ